MCARLSYTIQHRAVLTVFPLILQTVIITTGGEGQSIKRCHYASDKKETVWASKCTKNNLVACICLDPVGAYSTLQTSSWIYWEGEGMEKVGDGK